MNKVNAKDSVGKVYEQVAASPDERSAIDLPELKEESKQGVGWMDQKIREAKTGSILDDPFMKAFADSDKNPDVSYDIEIFEKDKDGQPYRYLAVASSPDGRYVSALCSNFKIRLIDLHAYHARESGRKSPSYVRPPATPSVRDRLSSTNSRNPDPAVDVYVDGPHADYAKAFKDELQCRDNEIQRFVELSTVIKWLPDSSNFVVTDPIQMAIYNVEACLQSLPGYCKTFHEFTDQKKDIDALKFQYFFQATICNEYYHSAGIHVLLTGMGNSSVTVTNFDMNNNTRTSSISNWPSISSESIKMPALYAKVIDTTRMSVHHNCSNHLCIEEDEDKTYMLRVYCLDTSAGKEAKRFELEHTAEKPHQSKIVRNSLGLYGKSIWYYSYARGEVSMLHLDQVKPEPGLRLPEIKKYMNLVSKDYGKYLLYVVESGWANLSMRTSTGSYLTLCRYYLNINPDCSNFTGDTSVSVGHDYESLEMLGDGGGSINYHANKLRYRVFKIAAMPTNAMIIVNQHFADCNILRNNDGTYTYEDYVQPVENNSDVEIQRIIDVKSKTPITTFNLDGTPDNLYSLENTLPILPTLSDGGLGRDYSETEEWNRYRRVSRGESINKVFYIGIPECSFTVIWFFEKNLLVGYRSASFGGPEVAWKIQVDDKESPSWSKRNKKCPFLFGNNGRYLLESVNGGGAKVYNIEAIVDASLMLKPIAIIPLGDCFYVIDSNRVIAVYEKPEQNDKPCRVMRVFHIDENGFVGEPIEGEFGMQPFVSPTSDYIFMPGEREMSVYGAKEGKIVSTADCHILDALHSVVDLQQCIFSPNGKIVTICESSWLEKVSVYSFPSLELITKLAMNFAIPIQRWCFTHDSKYLLIANKGGIINIYIADTGELLTKIELSDDKVWRDTIKTLSVNKESTELEIMFGCGSYICFKRMPLYPTSVNLALKHVHQKLTLFSQKTTNDNQIEESDVLSLITTSQQTYQLYLDSAYLKLLCLFNDRGLLTKYVEQLADRDLVFKYSSYAKIVSLDVKHMSISVNCFIDLIEDDLEKHKKFPLEVGKETLFVWLDDGLQINYHRKLLRLISFLPLNVPVQGELKDELRTVNEIATNEENITSEWMKTQKKALFKTDSPNVDDYDSFKTTFKFDMSKGSHFSIRYFEWMKRVSDEDLVQNYKGIIYYKWSRIYYSALAYSILLWILNGLFCAFMGFRPDSLGLLISILIINSLFILFELKCLCSNAARFIRDPWNFIDLLTHGFSIACVSAVYSLYTTDSLDPIFYILAWLRTVSFVLIGVRGLSMLRVFRPTRYLITMLFAVFHEMLAFLSVFGYVIFIYWFVCLVRPSLTHFNSEEEVVPENFFTSVQDALNIAFSNFDAAVDSTIVLVTSIMGNIVLGLVLLNYLIAIVSKTYETIADEKDLHDLKMVLTMIGEFDAFFAGLFKKDHARNYFILKPVVKEDMQATQLSNIVSEMAEQKASMAKQQNIIAELKASMAEQKAASVKQEATMAQMMMILAKLEASMVKPEPATTSQAALRPVNNNEADRKTD